MQKLKILNAKEAKKILELMKKQWGFDEKLDYIFLLSPKNKIYLINRDFSRIDERKLRIDSVGLYFGELKNDKLRLSIEGSQMIGPKAKKNIMELTKEEMGLWFKGNDLDKKTELSGFVIMKRNNDFLGTGKITDNKTKVMNFVPKTRRILAD